MILIYVSQKILHCSSYALFLEVRHFWDRHFSLKLGTFEVCTKVPNFKKKCLSQNCLTSRNSAYFKVKYQKVPNFKVKYQKVPISSIFRHNYKVPIVKYHTAQVCLAQGIAVLGLWNRKPSEMYCKHYRLLTKRVCIAAIRNGQSHNS